jgi:hypothetical protein
MREEQREISLRHCKRVSIVVLPYCAKGESEAIRRHDLHSSLLSTDPQTGLSLSSLSIQPFPPTPLCRGRFFSNLKKSALHHPSPSSITPKQNNLASPPMIPFPE